MKIFNIILFFIFSFNLLIGQSADDFKEHQIKAGETLWHLSTIYNVPVDSIKKWNNINIDSDKIIANKSLLIKLNMDSMNTATDEIQYHIVEKGEYLSGISAKYKLPMDSIIKWNDKSSSKIFEGEFLYLYDPNKIEVETSFSKFFKGQKSLQNIAVLEGDSIEPLEEIQVEKVDSASENSKIDSLNTEIVTLNKRIKESEDWLKEWMRDYTQEINGIEGEDPIQVMKKLHLSKRKSEVQDSIELEKLNLRAEIEFLEIELLKQEFLDYLADSELEQDEPLIEEKDTIPTLKEEKPKKEAVEFDSKKIAFSDAQKIDVVVFDNDISVEDETNKDRKKEKLKKQIEKESEEEVDETIALSEVIVKDTRKEKYKIGDKVDEMSRQKSEFYLTRAKKEIDNQNFKKANNLINKSLDVNPSLIEAYMIKGDLYALFDFYDKALDNYEKAKSLDRNLPQIYYNIGNCLIRKGKPEEALMSMRKAIKTDSTYILGYYGRSIIYLEQKQYEKAISDFNRILELNAYFFPAVKGRGIAHLNNGDYKEAIIDFNTVLNFDPNDERTFYLRGLSKLYLENLYEGCMDLLKASDMGFNLADKDLKKYCN